LQPFIQEQKQIKDFEAKSNFFLSLTFLTIMMRKFLILIIAVLATAQVFSQKKQAWNKPFYDSYPYHFGFAFTFGELDYSVKHASYFSQLDSVFSIEGKPGALFGASMVVNVKISDNWDFRFIPGLHFGQRTLNYIILKQVQVVNNNNILVDTSLRINHPMKIESTLLQFPLLVKYRAQRESNFRPYVVFGFTPAIDLATKKRAKEDEVPKIQLNKTDVYFDIGAGLDNYLKYFKFTTELRFSYGLMNMAKPFIGPDGKEAEYTTAFKRLGSKQVSLIIYFE
jgi:hypothetical protein